MNGLEEEMLPPPLSPEYGKEQGVESAESAVPAEPDAAALEAEVKHVNERIERQAEIIEKRTEGVQSIRKELSLPPTQEPIPIVEQTRESIERLRERRAELERRLGEVTAADVSHQYADAITEVRRSKIDWAHSPELARRLKLKGADDGDIARIRDWLVANAQGFKTFILPPEQFRETVEILHEMSGGSSNLQQGEAFYVDGEREDVPASVRDAIFLRENPPKPPLPPLPGRPINPDTATPQKSIDPTTLHHEAGHATQGGLLDSGPYKDWQRRTKEGAPDPEYVGSIRETDTRIRSMFRDMAEMFDPTREPFNEHTLVALRRKQREGQLSRDTLDLLANYDDATLIELANSLPAI